MQFNLMNRRVDLIDGKSRLSRHGAAVVEFASIAPVMILFTFGLIEISRVTIVKQTLTHATREGARLAVRPVVSTSDVVDKVNQELSALDIEGSTIETIPTLLQNAEPGSEVTVRITVSLSEVSWVPSYFLFSETDMVVETVMRRETVY